MNRIDWKRQARTGELATIDFRLERAASLVFLFDARDASYVAPEPGEHHAVDRSVEAAVEAFGALSDQGNMVGSRRSTRCPVGSRPAPVTRTSNALAGCSRATRRCPRRRPRRRRPRATTWTR
ncbi:DUF58 domain-containing protein [Halosimplex aquaticum]